jgi:citrate lyase subunit gamma (acyl carrier protein)
VNINHDASAGSLESCDIIVTLLPSQEGISIDLESSVKDQFGVRIEEEIRRTLDRLGVTAAQVRAQDQGALDCTIKARTIAAVYRAADRQDVDWEEINSWID